MGPSLDDLTRVLATARPSWPDTSVDRLLAATGGKPNPSRLEHAAELRIWLNAWNCRIPYPSGRDTDMLIPSLDMWWRTHRRRLVDVPLHVLDDRYIDAYARAYEALIDLPAGVNNVGIVRTLGPTASSKLLWVLRQRTACPWDVAIANAGGLGSRKDGYRAHLARARDWTQQIAEEAAMRGIDNLSMHLGRSDASLVRIYDEWCYLAFTRGIS
jgi:hypothetical protein